MKTASAFLQLLALSACLAVQLQAPGEFRMPGMRRALQTMDGIAVSMTIVIMIDRAEGLA